MSMKPIHLAVIATATILAASAVIAQPSISAPVRPEGARYSVEEVFSGLMFGAGPAASLFPQLWKSKQMASRPETRAAAGKSFESARQSLQKEEVIAKEDAAKLSGIAKGIAAGKGRAARSASPEQLAALVNQQIARKDPAFFERFRKEISSRDQRRVQAAMSEASKVSTQVVLGEINGKSPFERPIDPSHVGADAVINVNVAVNVDTAVNVNVAYNVDTVKNITNAWNNNFLDQASRLRNEVMVSQITQILGEVQYR